MGRRKFFPKIRPIQKISLGFLAIVIIGGLLLNMPIASTSGQGIHIEDALFTSFSAVCVTGLTVIEPGTDLTLFGQIILLVLIQMGGLGFMAIASMVFMAIGKKFTLSNRIVIKESLGDDKLQGGISMIKRVVWVTFLIEFLGILMLALRFIPEYGFATGSWYSIFHSISAFCNAGFDIFGQGNSIAMYASDPLVSLTICVLVILGGLGFFVMHDVKLAITKKEKLSLQSKVVLIMSAVLLVGGTVIIMLIENGRTAMGDGGFWDMTLKSFFQSTTTRTAGFASVPQGDLSSATQLVCIVLMFIGASPAGTGGGVKTTTFAAIILMLKSVIKGKSSITCFKRTLNNKMIMRALTISILVAIFIAVTTLLITVFEQGKIAIGEALYETTSAFATVGLSVGITPSLSLASKIVLMISMFLGRLGVLSIMSALAIQASKNENKISYPEGNMMIG